MDDHANVTLIRRFYSAFAESDHETHVRALLADAIHWHVAGDNPLAGDFHGHDEVLAAMRAYSIHSGGTLTLDTRSIFADDWHAIAVHWATARRPGFEYAAHEIDVFHMADGRISEFWSFSENQEATDQFWS